MASSAAKKTAKNVKIKPVKKKQSITKSKKTKKTTSKSTSSKKTNQNKKETVKKKVIVKKKVDRKKDLEVVLPTEINSTVLDKTQKIRKELDECIHKSFYFVAYVSAVCFILVGSAVAFSEVFNNEFSKDILKAEVITSEDGQSVEQVPEADVNILTTIPNNITEDFEVIFTARNIKNVAAFITPVNSTGNISLTVGDLLDEKYKTTILKQASPGYYQLKVAYLPLDRSGTKALLSNVFFIGTKEQEDLFNHEPKPAVVDTEDEKGVPEPEPELVDEKKVSDPEPVPSKQTVDDSGSDSEKEPVIKKDYNLKKSAEVTEDSLYEESITFLIAGNESNIMSEVKNIKIFAPDNFEYIELYARPLNSLKPIFVTLAKKKFNEWFFIVDTKNLPNNEYEFFAKTEYNKKTLKSPSVKFIVDNSSTFYSEDLEEVNEDTYSEDNNKKDQYVTPESKRKFVDISDIKDSFKTDTYEEGVDKVAQELISQNSKDIELLLKRYAVALQSGDEVLINTAKLNLEKQRELIIYETLKDIELRNISDNIDEKFYNRVEDYMGKVEIFEEIRREKSNGKTAVDSDNDGISDFDEVNIYNTNPNSLDTDNDGFSDGVEIIKGFNPKDSEPEAVIVFESPKSSTVLAKEEVLKIESVTPLIEKSVNDTKTDVIKSEIKGKAFPNSFVTIYIFSNPTIVTVKTDSDGSFVYTFDKELEDGKHDVYVAVTDNTGSIIAQSKPFSFVKEAQAFSPIDTDDETVFSTKDTSSTGPATYNVVVGLAVLSLGIILLMLGIGLRTKEPVSVLGTKNKDMNSGDGIITEKENEDNLS